MSTRLEANTNVTTTNFLRPNVFSPADIAVPFSTELIDIRLGPNASLTEYSQPQENIVVGRVVY